MIRVVGLNEFGKRIGEDHPNARLSQAQVDAIRDSHEEGGESYATLAKRYGVSKSTIWSVCNYFSYAQVPERFMTLRGEK